VTAFRAGRERTQQVELPNNVIFEPCLEDWLRDRPKDFQAGEVLLLDEDLWDIQRAAVKRRDSPQSEQVWEVDRGPAVGTVTYLYAADGMLRDVKVPTALQSLKRCSAAEAKSISYHKLVARDILEFPLDKEIGRADQLAEMTVRLSWAAVPFDRFHLEDERQHVVTRSEKEGRMQALVRIRRVKAAGDSLPLPVRAREFTPYLAETRYIKPRDPRLAETARRIVPSKANALEASRALSAWVATTVKPELIAETLTGPEVLHCKRGKCSEYAILFASMARSIGLPTRIVLGERLVGSHWVGHMWNEVFVGRWLTVDASVNEVGDALALLKFTHADSVAGTQPLRRDLTQSLSVSVHDFKSQTTPLQRKFTTGIDKGVYTNATFGCRVSVPDRQWSLEDQSKPGVATVRFRVPKDDKVLIHFAAFSLPVPLKTVTDARPTLYKNYKLVKDEEYAVGALKGRLLQFERSLDGKKVVLTEILWAKGSTGFIVNMRAEASAHARHDANFRKIVSSFELLPSEK
jgi:transglutaminase-like putative cysteine protease